jgi:hypothetical protein
MNLHVRHEYNDTSIFHRMMNCLDTIRVRVIELPIRNRYIEYSNRILGRILYNVILMILAQTD